MPALRRLTPLLIVLIALSALSGAVAASSHCGGPGNDAMSGLSHHHGKQPPAHSGSSNCDHCPPAQCVTLVACGGASQVAPTITLFRRAFTSSPLPWHLIDAILPTPPHDPPIRPPALI